MITLMTRPRGGRREREERGNRRLNNGIGADWYDIRYGTRSQHQQHQLCFARVHPLRAGRGNIAIYSWHLSFIELSLGFFVFFFVSLSLLHRGTSASSACDLALSRTRLLPEHSGRRLIVSRRTGAPHRRTERDLTSASRGETQEAWMIHRKKFCTYVKFDQC